MPGGRCIRVETEAIVFWIFCMKFLLGLSIILGTAAVPAVDAFFSSAWAEEKKEPNQEERRREVPPTTGRPEPREAGQQKPQSSRGSGRQS